MCEQDLEDVLTIESASFSRPWTRRHFLDEMESPFGFPLVALAPDGALAGYLCLKLLLDEAEILDVAVSDSQRCRGVGRILLEGALDLCRAGETAFVSLEVRAGNGAAIALYHRFDFRKVGRRKSYYENGEDAILMEYSFGGQAGECDAV